MIAILMETARFMAHDKQVISSNYWNRTMNESIISTLYLLILQKKLRKLIKSCRTIL
jgi:hypothetical protein